MKTLEELYNEVIASEDLKKEFLALKPEEVEGFAEKYGCKATFDEIKAYITEHIPDSGSLSDNELNQVTGGKRPPMYHSIFCA
ncbi:MAG: bacteriocin [Ruminiclostridium sp.]